MPKSTSRTIPARPARAVPAKTGSAQAEGDANDASRSHQPRHLTLDEIRPRIDFVAYWRLEQPVWYRYRVPSHQFLLIESGTIRARTAAGLVELHPGDLLCQPSGPAEYGFDEPVSYFEAHMSFAPPPLQGLTVWLDEAGPLPGVMRLGDARAQVQRCFEAMCLELDQPGAGHRLRALGAAHQLMALAADHHARAPTRPERLDVWQRARLRLENHLSRPLTVEEVAREAGFGVDHFIRQFKRRFGVSPGVARANAKLRFAARALSTGGTTIKALAHELGFADASTFARAFRRHIGVSPTELRVSGEAPAGQVQGLGTSLFPINRHIRPPEAGPGNFEWG